MRVPMGLAMVALALLVSLATGCDSGPPVPAGPGSGGSGVTAAEVESPTPAAAEPTATVEPTATALPSATPTVSVPAKRPIAVVVENEPPARPQSGLADADVVYEAVAEFDLTRFVAVFLDASVDTVGPVRSGRAYHAAIAAEYEAGLAHCLSVPSLPTVIAATNVVDLDGCRSGPAGFRREGPRKAPHNLYVSIPELREAAGGQGTYGALGRRQAWPAADQVKAIRFVYPEDHEVIWRYDASRQEYLRYQDGDPHLVASGRQVAASSVVVQMVAVEHSAYYGEAGYHELTQIGEGEATIYANGGKRAATWRRGGLGDPTRFFDSSGQEILLPPGRVFIQLVGMGTPVEESN